MKLDINNTYKINKGKYKQLKLKKNKWQAFCKCVHQPHFVPVYLLGGKDNPNCYFNQVQTQIAPATNMSHLLYSNPDTTTNR